MPTRQQKNLLWQNPAGVLIPGYRALYLCNGNLNDETGLYNATLPGGSANPTFLAAGGARFDGFDDHGIVNVPITGDYSIVSIVAPSSLGAFRTIAGSNQASAYLAFNTNPRVFMASVGASQIGVSAVPTVSTSQAWFAGGCVRRGAGVQAVRNETVSAQATITDSAETAITRIGARSSQSAWLAGDLHMLAVYPFALDAAQWRQLYFWARNFARTRGVVLQ